MKFKITHRILVKATENNHSYDVVAIDINSGMFKNMTVKQELTNIRVKQKLYSEDVNSGPLDLQETTSLINEFNERRKQLGYNCLVFDRIEDIKSKES